MEISHKTSLMPVILMLAIALSIPTTLAARQDYTVTLNSGATFETLRQPQRAPWDQNVILVLTDSGNWIALLRDDIDTITSSFEQSGVGTVVDSKTIAIGRLQEADEEEKDGKDGETGGENNPLGQLDGFLDRIQELAAPADRPVYNTDQFVNPEDAGGTAGFPADYAVQP